MHTLVSLKKFNAVAEPATDGEFWIQAWKYGEFEHPVYGTVSITPEVGQNFKEHFENNTYKQELLANYEHGMDPVKGMKSAGKVTAVDTRDDGVYYKVAFTESAVEEIKKGEWRYISPEYDDWVDPETGTKHSNVPMGVALTNRPFFKGMAALNFSEHYASVEDAERADQFAAWLQTQKTPVVEPTPQEDSDVNETLRKFAEALGIDIKDDDTEETILAKAKEFNEIVEPLRKVKEDGEKAKSFREQFPQEYEELQRSRAARLEQDARKFAEGYERFSTVKTVEKDGETQTIIENSDRGYSQKAIKAIQDIHQKFSEGAANSDDLKELLDTLASEDSIVKFSENGSSRVPEPKDDDTSLAPRYRFAEKVREIQEKDQLPYRKAMEVASTQYPELAAAYLNDRKEVK